MKPKIKQIHSPDIDDLVNFQPEILDNFAFLLQIIIGPENEEGEESFDIEVCTPKWLLTNYSSDNIILGLHKIIIMQYDYNAILIFLNKFLSHCHGKNWEEVSNKLSYLGKWEFDDYKE